MDPELLNVILYSGLVAAVSSAIIGAISNRLYFSYKFKKEGEAGFVQARAELYSRLWFWLKIWEAMDIDIPPTWEEFEEIDQFLSMRLHLISSDIQQKWLQMHGDIRDKHFEDAALTAKDLIRLVTNEFNEQILPKYEKYIGTNIQKLI